MQSKKILVVDDEKELQSMVSDILGLADFDVVTADDGEEGLEKIYSEDPDLILLDCEMPKLDGYELLEKMRSDARLINKPVIMLTVRNTEYDQIKGLKLGIDDYIVKPFKPTLLLARIKMVLERKALSLGANPLTHLAGNNAIKEDIDRRIREHEEFAMLYLDISNFKSFNDKYGFGRGDQVIQFVANILSRVVRDDGNTQTDFVGHIGGDDFLVVTSPDKYTKICEHVIQLFDAAVPSFYDQEDLKKGYIEIEDRQKNMRKFPFLTISIAVVSMTLTKIIHYAQLSEIAANLKKIAKQFNHSTYVVERRKE